MTAFYNEIDPYAAEWLRNLIAAGHIAPGVVDTRSIEDIEPHELDRFTQCHFFAGVGVWSLALRLAGVPDDRPLWTGSCPCQPFSAAGKGAGFSDERHLWPAWFHLIQQCRPAAVLGEQVASSDAAPWLDLVQDDLEAVGYAFGAVPFPSAGVGAPHIRDRLYWVADAAGARSPRRGARRAFAEPGAADRSAGAAAGGLADARRFDGGCEVEAADHDRSQAHRSAGELGRCGGAPGQLADADGERSPGHAGAQCRVPEGSIGALAGGMPGPGRLGHAHDVRGGRDAGAVPGAEGGAGWGVRRLVDGAQPAGVPSQLADDDDAGLDRIPVLQVRGADLLHADGRGPVNGAWAGADWIACRDGKWRPVEPGTFPLAHGAAARVGRLRAYGNAINAQAARVFIEAWLGD